MPKKHIKWWICMVWGRAFYGHHGGMGWTDCVFHDRAIGITIVGPATATPWWADVRVFVSRWVREESTPIDVHRFNMGPTKPRKKQTPLSFEYVNEHAHL